MRILHVGATGTIGRAVHASLSDRHDVIAVSRHSSPYSVDLTSCESIVRLYESIGEVDAVICTAGQTRFAPLDQLTGEDFAFSIENTLLSQIHLVRSGFGHVRDKGSFTLTGGTLARSPMIGGAAISAVMAGLEGFTRAAALEAPRGIRINLVSPPWLTETLVEFGMDPSSGLPATVVARAYERALAMGDTGRVFQFGEQGVIEPA